VTLNGADSETIRSHRLGGWFYILGNLLTSHGLAGVSAIEMQVQRLRGWQRHAQRCLRPVAERSSETL